MKDLTEGLDDKIVKGMKNKIDVLTAENYDLKNTLTKKDGEINSLNEKIAGLNSELESSKGKITDLENQVNGLTSSKEREATNLKSAIGTLSSKVGELTRKNAGITKSLSEKESQLGEISKSLEEKEKVMGEQKAHLEKVETELGALKPAEPTAYTSEDRLMCPSCGAVGKDIKTEEDKSKVLGYIGHKPMHGKVNVCKKCGEKF